MNETRDPFSGSQPLSDAVRLPMVSLSWIAWVNGVFGNIFIITTLLSQPALRSLHNIYIGNLAVADLILTGYCMTFWLVHMTTGYHPVVNKTHCIFNAFITCLTFLTSVLTLVAISVNRYFHVCRHSVFLRVFTKRRTLGLCVLTWVVSLCLSLNQLHGINIRYTGSDSTLNMCAYSIRNDFNLWVNMVLPLILPSVIVGFTNASIFNHWRRSRSRMQKWRQGSAGITTNSLQTKSGDSTRLTPCRSEGGGKFETNVEHSEQDAVFPESARENADVSLVNGCRSVDDVVQPEVNTASYENRRETECTCANLDHEFGHSVQHKGDSLPLNGRMSDQSKEKSMDESTDKSVAKSPASECAQHNPNYSPPPNLKSTITGEFVDVQQSNLKQAQTSGDPVFTDKDAKTLVLESTRTVCKRKRSNRQHLTASDISLIRSLLTVFICCVILYFPLAVAAIVEKFHPISPEVGIWTVACAFLNHCINWIVYGLMNRTFREGYKQQFVFCFRKCRLRT